nr:transaldolase family protein [Bradyrhizobium sp. BTAi1]
MGLHRTKNKAYSDVLYVEELIGPNTVNTMPPATLDPSATTVGSGSHLKSDRKRRRAFWKSSITKASRSTR